MQSPWFSTVWGVSSLAGPALGGMLTDQLSWRWVFYVTVPFSVVAAFILVRYVEEEVKPRVVAPIDWWGAGLLALGSTCLLLAVLQGSGATVLRVGLLLGLAVAILVGFVVREHHAADPVLPLDLISRGPIAAAIVGSFAIGALLFGIDTYIPLFVQGVRGGTATEAGWTMTPLFVSWALSVFIAVWVVIHLGFRATAVAGATIATIGTACIAAGAQWPALSRPLFMIGMIITGIGFGPTSLSFILSTQNSVDWGQRGVATGAITFFRTIGGALGVGFLGATLGFGFAGRLADAGATGIDAVAALRPETHARLGPEQLAIVQAALGRTLRDVFLQMFVVGVVALIASTRLARGQAQDKVDAPDDLVAALHE